MIGRKSRSHRAPGELTGTRALTLALLGGILGLTACGGATAPDDDDPPRGTAVVTVQTVGQDADLDGYEVFLSGPWERDRRVSSDETQSASFELLPGTYTAELRDVAGNCTVDAASRTLDAVDDQSVTVAFHVACADIAPLGQEIVIAVAAWQGAAPDLEPGLYVYHPQTGASRRLTIPPSGAWDSDPHVSPDGKHIVILRRDGSAESIHVVNADGTEEPGGLTRGENPRWSPDGTWIAFEASVGDVIDIHLIRPDGTGLVNLTRSTTTVDIQPDWSPDGSRIAYHAIAHSESTGELYVMSAAGTDRTQLTNPSSGADFAPRWSPDGTRIAFNSSRTGAVRVWIMNADGTNPALLVPEADGQQESGASWSPDGTLVLFRRWWNDDPFDPELFLLDLADGSEVQFTDNTMDERVAHWHR